MRLQAFIFPAATLALLLPPPDGPYKVMWNSRELVDEHRVDPFNSSHPRRLMVSVFSAVPESQCETTCQVPYMPPVVAATEDSNVQGELGSNATWPFGVLAQLEMEVCCEKTAVGNAPEQWFPTLLFGPGLNETRLSYSAVAQQISSLGYNVIVMDHPYETDIVLFPDGEIIYGNHVDQNNQSSLDFGLEVRTRDASFVMDTFGLCSTVYLGHSFGGAAAANALLYDQRAISAVNLDGVFVGHAITHGVPHPLLSLGSASHECLNTTIDPSWAQFFDAMATKHLGIWTEDLNVHNSEHNSFSDYSLIADVADLRGNVQLTECFLGQISGQRMMQILRAYISEFVRFTLQHCSEGILGGPSEEFPDVTFLRPWRNEE